MSNDSSWANQKQEFNDLCKLWDKAQNDGIFDAKGTNQDTRSDFFGQNDFPDEVELTDSESSYWDDVLRRSGEMMPDESMVLMEAARKKAESNKKKTKKKAPAKSKLGRGGDTATGNPGENPPFKTVKTSLEGQPLPSKGKKASDLASQDKIIGQTTYGRDGVDDENKVQISAGLAAHPKYAELEKLKKDFASKESEILRKMGVGKKTDYYKALQDIRKKIDALCDAISGDYTDSHKRS